jgi:hypothetical protein
MTEFERRRREQRNGWWRGFAWTLRGGWATRPWIAAIAVPVAAASIDGGHLGALPPPPAMRVDRTAEEARIEAQPICIGSATHSAGDLSDVLYYRAIARDDGRIEVGYYAFFSEERPWGNNWMTWTVLPALAIDLTYSRTLLVAPGVQRALYGPGDVEGVGVVYDVLPNGSLHLAEAHADDGHHAPVSLSRADAYGVDPARPTFYSDVWSHQLGGRGARSTDDLVYERCYDAASIRPLPDSVARTFRVDVVRAPPAHVERHPGRRIDHAPEDEAPGIAQR